ncbi:NAD-dependent epimerase/dehydratase family protein [Candidatus Gottesmanbacteria bacterium]|nr:NAD-dependent epimerase/dehydratase family protein [Candidatus Gottesmanbacteria bacterium]
MQKDYWTGKGVLITGAGGFVGTNLTKYLARRGAHVVGISRDGRAGVKLDTQNKVSLFHLVVQKKPHVVFHLAADALVEEGEQKPYETIKNNIISSLNILEAARVYKISRVVIASTVHVYGDGASPFYEDDPPRPSRPYETSKTCVDIIAQSYADTFHLPVLIPRFVNIYGPGDTNRSRLIPKTITAVLGGKRPTLWGGKAQREYLYIDDALRAYDALARLSDATIDRNRIFNFGAQDTFTVEEVVGKILAIANSSVSIRRIKEERSDEIIARRVSWQKAKRILNWQPTVDFATGLKKTLAWYRTKV